MLDPQVQALLTRLESAGAVPLVRGSAADTRQHDRGGRYQRPRSSLFEGMAISMRGR